MGISENADSPLLCSREIKLMQYSKDDIQKEILKAAEKVFLENGFPKASMREIAQEAQVGLSNIYNYFKNKDDIFCTVVRPVISAFERMLRTSRALWSRYHGDVFHRIPTICDRRVHDIDTKASQIVGIAIFPCTGFFTGKLQGELHRTLHITCERVFQRYERKTSANEYQCNRLFYPPAHGMDVHHV